MISLSNSYLGDFQLLEDMKSYVMGASAVLANLIDRFGWVKLIDDAVGQDDYKLSIGTRIKALLINIGTDRKALYKVQRFYERRDVEVLLGEGVTASDLNDDALGRALDRLHDLDLDSFYPQLAYHTVRQLRVIDKFNDLLPFHSDTTSVSLTGEYACQEEHVGQDGDEDEFRIARGYSKDHRPDLKQIIFGLTTLGGLPFCANVDKGNQDDHTWNLENIPRLFELADEAIRQKAVYIADSAAVTEDNLELFASEQVHFISRLPSTYKLCESLKLAAWEGDSWTDALRIGTASDSATYKLRAFRRELYGRTYRFIVVRSSSLDARKEHKLQDVLERERKSLTKDVERASKVAYSCMEDASAAAELFEKAHTDKRKQILHSLRVSVSSEKVQEKRRQGRPRKDEPAPATRTLSTSIEISPKASIENSPVSSIRRTQM